MHQPGNRTASVCLPDFQRQWHTVIKRKVWRTDTSEILQYALVFFRVIPISLEKVVVNEKMADCLFGFSLFVRQIERDRLYPGQIRIAYRKLGETIFSYNFCAIDIALTNHIIGRVDFVLHRLLYLHFIEFAQFKDSVS